MKKKKQNTGTSKSRFDYILIKSRWRVVQRFYVFAPFIFVQNDQETVEKRQNWIHLHP